MRSYPRNSPEAAARLVTLALLADGDLSRIELQAVETLQVHQRLGLDREALREVLHDFCDDLLSTHRPWGESCRIDPQTLAGLLAEVDEPALRRLVLQLCVAIVEADRHVAEGESMVLVAAVEQWGLQHEMLDPTPVA
ncbi:tellurite resistance protein TerB [Sphaerotilus hippei]|uniref:Tellurite resistance protein TerB n=1 Tax=Sphaerotilus hippei TaxID=744406 RepID=A0A318GYP9_9BURK|nr:TerB family tellurite resistance protein [Sphaerotilus hippei]PXW95194.1 tellurite resistance protein TerB [Sphaerotilus hippei]